MRIIVHVYLRVRWISVEMPIFFLSEAVAGVRSDLLSPVSSELG